MSYHPERAAALIASAPVQNFLGPESIPRANDGKVMVSAKLRHMSLITYAIPSDRVRGLLPRPLQIDETRVDGRMTTWLSIFSYLDCGAGVGGVGSFEQSSFRLHALYNGKPAHWLLGISIGSLSAIATRSLWRMPWHLSAMEFQAAYDRNRGGYRQYRLQIQSQWANSSWEIRDSGQSLALEKLDKSSLPSSFRSGSFINCFSRMDGSIGGYKVGYPRVDLTRGDLTGAHSDLLIRLGLLDKKELMNPLLVGLQYETACHFFSPTVLKSDSPFRPARIL